MRWDEISWLAQERGKELAAAVQRAWDVIVMRIRLLFDSD